MTWEQTLKEEYKLAYKEAYNEASQAKAIENARNLLSEGISPEVIVRCCSLLHLKKN